jgi:uncharacterized protein (DUF2236 family)
MVQPADGALYPRDSLAWRINSQSFVLLGGPRAAILQVCDPGVAAGVAEFSSYRSDPLGRLERTLHAMLAVSFGTPERREAVLAGLEKAHAKVRGRLADGTEYDALEPERQFWVLATLTDTVIEVDRRYLGKMRPADRAAYYEESKRLASAFGVPDRLVPSDYDAFRSYMAERFATLQPTQQSRDITATLLVPRVRFVPGIAWLPLTLVTTELLPRRMRRGLRLRDLNPAELATVRAGQLAMRNSLAHLGGVLAANPLNGRATQTAA